MGIYRTSVLFMQHYCLYVWFVFSFLSSVQSFGQQRYNGHKASLNASLYQPVDLVFKQKVATGEHPFDLKFGAVLTAPDSTTLQVPGFYGGDNSGIWWLCAWAPTKIRRKENT